MPLSPPVWAGSSLSPFRGCKVWKSGGAQAITGGNSDAVTFDAEVGDTHSFHDASSNTDRIVIPAAFANCWVALYAGALMSTPSTGYCIVQIRRTRSAVATELSGLNQPAVISGSDYYQLDAIDLAAAADYYQLIVTPQNNGSVTNDLRTFFALQVLGR